MAPLKHLNLQDNIWRSSSVVVVCSVYSKNLKLYSSKDLILQAKCIKYLVIFRSSRPDVFCKKGVLRNFVKFIGKHLCQSLYFDKVAGLTLLKQRLWHKYFPVTFPKFRGRHRRCSVKKGVLRNFAKFTGKQLCQGLFFNKVAGLNCFPVSFAKCLRTPFLQKPPGDCFLKFLRTPFLKEHLRWLLLYMTILVTLLLIFIC